MTWHILKKDFRRLTAHLAVTLAVLGALSVLDIWRYDFEAGLAETVLNLLVPLAWAVLIAMAVQQEPLTSDTAFWLTRPYRRSSLLLAKVAFALLAVHVPLWISHAVILMSHGFTPVHPQLWWKQLTVLLAVTLPSLALASMTNTVAGFGWCALAAGATALLLDAALLGRRVPWMQNEWIPAALTLLLITAGTALIIGLQYARRTVWLGRIIGLAAALSAVLFYSYLPRDLSAALQCSVEPDVPTRVTVRFQPEAAPQPVHSVYRPDRTLVTLPLKVNGVENARHVWAEQIWLRLSTPDGRVWETTRKSPREPGASLSIEADAQSSTQILAPDRHFVNAVAGLPLRVEGRASIRPVRGLAPRVLPSQFPPTQVPGIGRCTASLTLIFFGRQMLKILCESPDELPMLMRIQLLDPVSGQQWQGRLGDATSASLPTIVWLSPLNRRQTFLHIVETESVTAGDRWHVPRDVVDRAHIQIEPWVPMGCVNVDYSFDVADLRRWEVRNPASSRLR